MFTWECLYAGTDFTVEDAKAELLKYVQDLGIRTTDWSDGAPETIALELASYLYAKQVNRVGRAVRANTMDASSGSALTSFSDSWFDNQRVEATLAKGIMQFTASSDIVPITFAANELQVTDGNYVFTNDEAFTLTSASNASAEYVTADDEGAAYNINDDSTLTFVGTVNGLTAYNPPNEVTLTASWLTQLGVDDEEDATLKLRNRTKFSTFEKGSKTVDYVKALAVSASAGVVDMYIDDQNPRGQFTVDVYLAQSASTATGAQVSAVQTAFDDAFFGNTIGGLTLVSASMAEEREFNDAFNVLYKPNLPIDIIKQAVNDKLDEWVSSIPTGGKSYLPATGSAYSMFELIRYLGEIDDLVSVSGLAAQGYISMNKNQKLIEPAGGWDSLIVYTEADEA